MSTLAARQLLTGDHQAERDPDEEGDYMAFEQLMAEATAKREKKDDKKKEKASKHSSHFGHSHAEKTAGDATTATAK